MPRLINSVPKYCKHRASGQATVTIGGKDYYLGPHGTKASKVAYDRLIGEWLANDRRPFRTNDETTTIINLAAAFWRHAQKHYVKNGRPTCEQAGMKIVLRYLKESYGNAPAAEFTPLSLETIRNQMVARGNSRGYVNQNIGRIKHIFKWGVSKQLVPETVHRALATLEGLQEGKCDARETEPVGPVDERTIEATLPHLKLVVADMVKLQQRTGCRPEEICAIRPCDIERTQDVWRYTPHSHKMQHRGTKRVVMIGPHGQAILLPYLLRNAQHYCFINSNCGREFSSRTYRDAVHRGCELAFGFPMELKKGPRAETADVRQQRLKSAAKWRAEHCWNPNQIRHKLATEIRKKYGCEAAQTVLGHVQLSTTEIYAERDLERAAKVIAEVG